MTIKNIEYYMNLSYTFKFQHVKNDPGYPDGYYYGGFVELDGCKASGKTVEELLKELEQVKRAWIEIKLESNEPIPEPDFNNKN
ncbi:type II toxin-antitoxin system HicB family antitoxin [Paenibacillus luteus]|uniref:type II toxin-antitoxin system HicB family antitoxin n=1 Tax=Paenibacillus luteus TaxID=2545753 RepID=UPI0011444193|nr:type II toxin-antitoxin system HicB family antitoxin [Paenibacillus luteus]